jgi:plastocyanin
MLFPTVAVISAFIAGVSAITHDIVVGDSNQNVFKPNSVSAAVGDTVNFIFVSKNHTVTQSTFGVPCSSKQGGFDSNYIAVSNATAQNQFPSWSITLTNTDAIWVYCKQGNHCGQGMVMAINPTAEKSFDMYLATAKATLSGNGTTTGNTTAPGATGAGAVGTSASISATASAGVSATASAVRGAPSASGSATPSSISLPGTPLSGAPRGAESIKVATGLLTLTAIAMGLML